MKTIRLSSVDQLHSVLETPRQVQASLPATIAVPHSLLPPHAKLFSYADSTAEMHILGNPGTVIRHNDGLGGGTNFLKPDSATGPILIGRPSAPFQLADARILNSNHSFELVYVGGHYYLNVAASDRNAPFDLPPISSTQPS